MSKGSGLNLKLNKKLKVSLGKPKNYINRDATKPSVEKDCVIGGKTNSESRRLKDDGRRMRVDSHKNLEATHKKVSSGKHSKTVKGDLNKERKSNGKASPPLERATSRNPKNGGTRAKEIEIDSTPNDSSKKHANARANSTKKVVRVRKSLKTDSEVVDDKPKKKKRVIRLDPYDISNKRLDDGIATDESKRDKKKDLEENAAMSKNAQFRGIQPSPSILSFVEDNLLGRRRSIEIQRAGYNTELSAPLDNIPFSTNPERERVEENIFRNKLQFFAAAKVSSSFPAPDIPEIAFAGRSNVGKSSLLNALTRQWGVVRTSDKPGLTQSINFFQLGSKLCLVDLPGYGFAYAKEEVKEAWEELVKEYVSTRVGLKRVCLLIDTKWGMKPRDNELIDLMERSQTKYQIVLTKTDTVFPIDVARRAMQIEEGLKANRSVVQPVMMVSSKSGAGIRSLRTVLSKVARMCPSADATTSLLADFPKEMQNEEMKKC
ncbi:P-loop containing nucleoside triphosphate hydrolases superfamily protein isoform 1 [Gossypium australe]|uniref:P-loop containing nucleoside triphosphate hydrolases superfamily protein isoform 1 n=1 Tax=Gossypium australe TaxID=47621 RepID=A0A5B6UFJ1_9ROSI|nr:P-loop containing nucleoside triphosphate hydrolases superfamily protein isoform 1 [Gossypium australe]